jgi:hypothetical protein
MRHEVFENAPCVGQHWLFDSTDPEIHKQAKELCADCPALLACQDLLIDVQQVAKTMCTAGGGPMGTWAGRLVGKPQRRGWKETA